MKLLLKKILWVLAKLTLARYKPRIVAITGSVGKTSTKEAVALVLSKKFSVRKSLENYNNEFGVPLTIIGEKSGGRNLFVWFWIFVKAKIKLIHTKYPEVLVLELGADRPGDIAYLVGLLGNIEVAILTDIGISHLEFFANQAELAKEKTALIKKLSGKSLAILNFDNFKVFDARNLTKAEVLGYGFNQNASAIISELNIVEVGDEFGINFKILHRGTVVPFFLPNVLGRPAAYVAAAAALTGLRFGIDLATSSEALKKYQPPAGRLRLIKGIKNTQILDDTYNAAPDSTIAALDALGTIAMGRKVTVIGSMTELGSKTESGHRDVAKKIFEEKIDLVFLVGENAKFIQDELKKLVFGGKVLWFETSDQACLPVQKEISESDTILIKGSQATRMEKIVKEIMAEPLRAEELLVRQSGKWLK